MKPIRVAVFGVQVNSLFSKERFWPLKMMEIVLFVLFSSLGSLGAPNVASVECTEPDNKQYADCACQMSDSRKFVNLAALRHNFSVPRFTVKGIDLQDENWLFSYNPCTTFDMFKGESNVGDKACINVAAARWTNQSAHRCDGLGNSKSAIFHYNSKQPKEFVVSNLTLSFQNMTNKESAVISLVCNSSIPRNKTVFKHLGTDNAPQNTYYLSLEGECCCPGLCDSPPGGSSNKGESGKDYKLWIILGASLGGLLLFIAVVAYCCSKKKREYESV